MGLTADTESTAGYYDRWTELFHRGSGPVFQAGILKTGIPPKEDPEASVLALADRAGIAEGQAILDAGCGVGGPASIIARRFPDVTIEAITNSSVQAQIASREMSALGLGDRVRVYLADYQRLPFVSDCFDRVLYFESTGYASDVGLLYSEAARVLRPGGLLYVKDVFMQAGVGVEGLDHMRSFDSLWGCVRSKTVAESVDAINAAGLRIIRATEIQNIGTARLAGSMFTLDQIDGLQPTELGECFAMKDLDPPIEFAEILAVK